MIKEETGTNSQSKFYLKTFPTIHWIGLLAKKYLTVAEWQYFSNDFKQLTFLSNHFWQLVNWQFSRTISDIWLTGNFQSVD